MSHNLSKLLQSCFVFFKEKFIPPKVKELQLQEQRKFIFLEAIHLLAIFILLTLTIFSLLKKDFYNFTIDISTLIFGILNLYLLRKTFNTLLTSVICLSILGVVFFFIYQNTSLGHSRIIWYYIYPSLAFFLLGIKRGFLFLFIFYGLPITHAFFSETSFIRSIPIREGARYISVLFAIGMISLFDEYYKNIFQKKLVIETRERQNLMKTKIDFIGKVSHDLKTPLNAVVSSLSILASLPLKKDQKQMINTSLKSARILSSIIRGAVNMAEFENKLETPATQTEEKKFELANELFDIEKSFYSKASEQNISFTALIDKKLYINARGSLMRFKILCLQTLQKALRLCEDSQITLAVNLKTETDFLAVISFNIFSHITANGNKKKLLLKSNSQTIKREGENIFSISKNIAQSLGGNIDILTEKSKLFSIVGELTFEKESHFKRENSHRDKILKNKKILVVGSNQNRYRYVKNMLEETEAVIEYEYCASYEKEYNHLHNLLATKKVDLLIFKKPLPFPNEENAIPTLVINNNASFEIKKPYLNHLLIPFNKEDIIKTIERIFNKSTKKQTSSEDKLTFLDPKYKVTFLVVDDNFVNQKVLQAVLKSLHYKIVVLARNGKEALEKWKERDYAMIFMDCHMRIMDGYEATIQIRKIEKATSKTKTPIIAITASSLESSQKECIACGMDDYLSKPILREDIEKMIKKHFSEKKEQKKSITPVAQVL